MSHIKVNKIFYSCGYHILRYCGLCPLWPVSIGQLFLLSTDPDLVHPAGCNVNSIVVVIDLHELHAPAIYS